MTDQARLAAALLKVLFYPVVGLGQIMTYQETAERIIAADPTLVCPDPEKHRLDLDGKPFCPTGFAQRYHDDGLCGCWHPCPDPADHELAAAVNRLPGDTDIAILRLDTDYGPEWHLRFHERRGSGDTLEAAIAAALEDKP